jgi:hypothetical protein
MSENYSMSGGLVPVQDANETAAHLLAAYQQGNQLLTPGVGDGTGIHRLSPPEFYKSSHALRDDIMETPGTDIQDQEATEHLRDSAVEHPHIDLDDDISVEDFLQCCRPDGTEADQVLQDWHRCAGHLAKAKQALCGDDLQEAYQAVNSAMAHFARAHQGIKRARRS